MTGRASRLRWGTLAGAVLLAAGVGTAAVHNVSTVPTDQDRKFGRVILEKAGYRSLFKDRIDHSSFAAQVRLILAVQDAVITVSPKTVAIPFDRPREPMDLVAHGYGECGDRSRAIEKILNGFGFRTRHMAIYSVSETGSRVASLLTPRVGSHAVTRGSYKKGLDGGRVHE